VPNHRRQDRELDALYATLPHMECRGYCHDSCGPIGMSQRERARIIERARQPITCGHYASCSMLTAERKCSVYDIRPMICRLWGLIRSMPCPYGCRPEGGLLKDEVGVKLLLEADRIGGAEGHDHLVREALQTLAALGEAEVARRATAIFSGSRPTLQGRDGALEPTVLHQPEVALDSSRRVRRSKG
jgi:hypothetical protein